MSRLGELLEEQLYLETAAVEEGIEAYNRQVLTGGMMPPHVHLLTLGMGPLTGAIAEFQKSKTSQINGKLQTLIRDMKANELAYLVLWYVFTHTNQYTSLQSVALGIGNEILDHLEFNRFKASSPAYLMALQKRSKTKNRGHLRTVVMRGKNKCGVQDLKWSKQTKIHIGTTMLDLLIQSTGMFARSWIEVNKHGNERPAVLVPSPEVEAWLTKAHEQCALMSPKYHVCVVPPKNWKGPTGGGFHSGAGSMKITVVKTPSEQYLKDIHENKPKRMYDLLNRLQKVAWKVNGRVLQVLNEVWLLPGRLNVIAKGLNKELPEKHWTSDEEWEKWKAENPEKAKEWKRKARDAYAARSKAEGQLVNLTNILGRARKYADMEQFYYCWQMDYRGRVYPVQSHLTPQSCDLSKGLLQFADGKPLGKSGGYWLKIHLANCYGNKVDKRSLEERLAWVQQYEKAIIDSARFPIDGVRLWTEAEDPWQFLAAAMEYADWADTGFSEDFVSHIPVSVDGSCNGLQHLSALMRDEQGAFHVNMLSDDEPQDIYSRVAERVAVLVEADLGSQEEWKDKGITIGELAEKWHGKVDRKIVKRNVMTLPYGVTSIGMRDQIEEELLKSDKPGLEELAGFTETAYLVSRIIVGIGEIIQAADTCMKWLRSCAQVFNRVGVHMEWFTPAGLMVKQLYWQSKVQRIVTYWGDQQVNLKTNIPSKKMDPHKQISGSAPNVIHSFDAAHLCMTVERCWDQGLRHFAMVHDSYGVHACDVEVLGVELREAFVDLYSVDRLTELRDYWQSILPPDVELDPVPELGNLDLSRVRGKRYFFV